MSGGLRPRKPIKRVHVCFDLISAGRTTNRQLRTTGDELKVAAAGDRIVFRHNLDQILNRLAIRSEPVVRFERLTQRWYMVLDWGK